MPAAVMDIEAPSSSEKQVTESVMEEVQSSAPNLLFEGSLDTATSSEIFSDMPDLKQESITNKSVTSSDVGYTSSIGQLHRSPKDIESPAAFYGCCGFYNLGNTCFMNAGLQCLFCNTHLVKFFHEQFVLNDVSKDTLTGKFCQLVRKVWSGNFSLIHPLDFKGTLGMYYPQFHDFRQHDCQEFVTLLLDSLHESLNNARNNNNNNNNNAFQKPMQATSSKSEQMAHTLTHSSSLDTSSSSSMNVITQKSHSSVSSSLSHSTKHTISAAAATEAEYDELVAAAATATTTATNSTSLATRNQNNSHMFSLQHEQQAGNTAMGISSSSKLNLASYNTASAISNKVEIQPKSSALISNISNCDLQQQQPSNSKLIATTPGVRVALQGCSSGHKKPFHYTPNQLYTQGYNHQVTMVNTAGTVTNTTTTNICCSAAENISSSLTDVAAGLTTSSALEECTEKVGGVKGQRQFSSLVRNFDSSPQKEMNQSVIPDNYISSSTQLYAANSGSNSITSSTNQISISSEAATNNRLGSVLSFQNDSLCASSDQFLVHSTNMSEAGAVGPKCLPNIEDFYAKEMKTLNTNVLVSELEEQIQTDSEKFVKSDNRNRLNAENCDNNLEQILGAEAAKADLGPGQEKVKDINIRLDKKSRSYQHYPSPSCKSGLHYEDWSNINNIKRIKIEADGDEKNMKRQALQKFNLDHSTVRVEEIMADPGCTMDEENEEEEEDMAMEKDDDVDDALLEDEEAEVSSGGERHCKTSPLHESPGPDADYTTADIEAADHSWGCHLIKNNSIVVDTFHGQFKNTVVCSECCHVSVTYEPFMYLSVPIPHAMERQLCVIFMPQVRSMPPVRYLLNLNKNDNIYKAKTELREVASQPDCDIIMVEVVDSHITRVLDDNILLRFVNDSARKIYAFEMAAPPSSLDSSPTDSIGDLSAVSSSFSAKEDLTTVQPCSSTSPDIFTNMDTFTLDSFTPPSTPATVALSSVSNTPINTSYTAGFTNTVTASSCKLKAPLSADTKTSVMESVPPNPTSTDETTSGTSKCFSSSSVFPDSAMKEESDLCDSSVVSQQQQSSSHSKSEVNATNSPNMWDWPPPVTSPSSVAIPMTWESNLDTCDQPQQQPIVSSSSLPPMAEHWRSCAICLEELLDTGLMVHASCGGTFCHSCLEMSLKHHSVFSYTCPVCLAFANPSVEFVPLADPESKRLRTRILAVPIAFRCLSKTDSDQLVLVGHPHILYLPNNISGNVLYSCVDQVVPALLEYTIVYTTEEGLQCSRCPSFNQCHGCIVQRMGRITLQPGDHLTVMLNNISTKQLDELMQKYVINHDSMENLRPDTPMSIYDCFRAFMQSETLDEHNPWFCPSCCKNCRAKKTMTVWRYPDNLIIYLKRFVFHELTSTKIDNLVSFPLEHLDLSEFSSGPRTKHLIYDLHSIVCHFGGSNSGHYTCYAKHPKEDVWYYYNDETVCQQVPRDDHMSSAYVLFYVRQGTDVSFQVPDKASYQFLGSGLNNSPTYNNATTHKPLNSGYAKGSDQSMALVLYQPQPLPTQTSTASPTSSSSLLSCQRVVESSDCSAKTSSPGPAESTSTASEQVEPDSTYDFYS